MTWSIFGQKPDDTSTPQGWHEAVNKQKQRLRTTLELIPGVEEALDQAFLNLYKGVEIDPKPLIDKVDQTLKKIDLELFLLIDLFFRRPEGGDSAITKEPALLLSARLGFHHLSLKAHQLKLMMSEHFIELGKLEQELGDLLEHATEASEGEAEALLMEAIKRFSSHYREFPRRDRGIEQRLGNLIERVAAQCAHSCPNRSLHPDLYQRLDPVWMATHHRAQPEKKEDESWEQKVAKMSLKVPIISPFLHQKLTSPVPIKNQRVSSLALRLEQLGVRLLRALTYTAHHGKTPDHVSESLRWKLSEIEHALCEFGGDFFVKALWDAVHFIKIGIVNLRAAEGACKQASEEVKFEELIAKMPIGYRKVVYDKRGNMPDSNGWKFFTYREIFERGEDLDELVIVEDKKGNRLLFEQNQNREKVIFHEPSTRSHLALTNNFENLIIEELDELIQKKKKSLEKEAETILETYQKQGGERHIRSEVEVDDNVIKPYKRLLEIQKQHPSAFISDCLDKMEIPFLEMRAKHLADAIDQELDKSQTEEEKLQAALDVQPFYNELLEIFNKRPTIKVEIALRRARVSVGVVRIPKLVKELKEWLTIETEEAYEKMMPIYEEIVSVSVANEKATTTAMLNDVQGALRKKASDLENRALEDFGRKSYIPFDEIGRCYRLLLILRSHLNFAVIDEAVDHIEEEASRLAEELAIKYKELRYSNDVSKFKLVGDKVNMLRETIPIKSVQKSLKLGRPAL